MKDKIKMVLKEIVSKKLVDWSACYLVPYNWLMSCSTARRPSLIKAATHLFLQLFSYLVT